MLDFLLNRNKVIKSNCINTVLDKKGEGKGRGSLSVTRLFSLCLNSPNYFDHSGKTLEYPTHTVTLIQCQMRIVTGSQDYFKPAE